MALVHLQANQWMKHCQDYFLQLSMEPSLSSTVVENLQVYYREASKFSMENFSTLNDMVLSLDSPQQLQHWNCMWSKCQQTKQQLEETLGRAATATAAEDPAGVGPEPTPSSQMEDQTVISEQLGSHASLLLPGALAPLTFEDSDPASAGPFPRSPSDSTCSSTHFVFPSECDGKLRQSPSAFDDTDSDCTVDSVVSCHSEPVYASRLRKQPMKKIMKKTMSYELSPRDAAHSDGAHLHGYTGVYIKGLEVANNVSAEKKLQRPDVTSPALGRSRSMSTPSRAHGKLADGDAVKQSRWVKSQVRVSGEKPQNCH